MPLDKPPSESPVESAHPMTGGIPVFGPREKLALWILLGSTFLVFINETFMNVGTAVVMRDLSITASAAQWLTTAYLLTMSVIIPMTGLLIQRFSTRTLFIAAMTVFTLGTAIAACAPGFEVLLVGRVVQAVGTSVMQPLLMTTITLIAPPGQRGRLMSYVTIVGSVAPAFGPTLSGFVLQWLSWRWLFIFMLPLAIVSVVLGIRRMPNVGVQKHAKIDALSIVLAAFAFGGIVYGLSAAGAAAVGSPTLPPYIPLSVGVITLALFVWRQFALQREDRALLDMRVFESRTFTLSTIAFAVGGLALFGALFLIPLYAQNVLHFGPALTGFIILPGSLLMAVLAPPVGRMVDATGGRGVLIAGMAITAVSVWSMALFDVDTPIWQLFATNIVMNIGLSGIFTPLYSIALGSLRKRYTSHGSAMIGTMNQLAGAASTALLVTIMTVVSVNHGGLAQAEAPESLVAGTRFAFIVAAIIATLGVIVALFIHEDPESAQKRRHVAR